MILFRQIPERARDSLLLLARGIAVVAGIFTFAVSVLMIADYLQLSSADPLDTPTLVALRERYVDDPEASGVADDIRALDLLARKAYFTRTWQLRTGTFLLIGGSLLLVASLRVITLLKRAPKVPDGAKVADGRRVSRLILVAIGAFVVLGAVITSLFSRSLELPETTAEAVFVKTVDAFPESYEENWPGFRGPYGNGKAIDQEAPTEWDGQSGLNIKWIAEVPAPGFSSPVVWEDRIFVSGATDTRQSVFCFSVHDGSLLWERRIGPFPGSPPETPRVTLDTGFAASTPATDGEYLYVIFATGDIAAVDFDGAVAWGMNMGVPDNHYGHSSSLSTYADTVIVLYDHAESTGLYALDARNGSVRWKTERDTQTTWSSPAIGKVGPDWAIFVNANYYFAAYAADDGHELYRYEGILGEVASSPAFDEQHVIVVNQIMSVVALDIADGTFTWELYDDLPDTTSPLLIAPYVYLATSFGTLTSTHIDSGEVAWRTEFDEGFYSSPVSAGGYVYIFDRTGRARIFEPAAEYREVSSPILGEKVDTTPAFTGGRIFIRGDEGLFCIEDSDG